MIVGNLVWRGAVLIGFELPQLANVVGQEKEGTGIVGDEGRQGAIVRCPYTPQDHGGRWSGCGGGGPVSSAQGRHESTTQAGQARGTR